MAEISTTGNIDNTSSVYSFAKTETTNKDTKMYRETVMGSLYAISVNTKENISNSVQSISILKQVSKNSLDIVNKSAESTLFLEGIYNTLSKNNNNDFINAVTNLGESAIKLDTHKNVLLTSIDSRLLGISNENAESTLFLEGIYNTLSKNNNNDFINAVTNLGESAIKLDTHKNVLLSSIDSRLLGISNENAESTLLLDGIYNVLQKKEKTTNVNILGVDFGSIFSKSLDLDKQRNTLLNKIQTTLFSFLDANFWGDNLEKVQTLGTRDIKATFVFKDSKQSSNLLQGVFNLVDKDVVQKFTTFTNSVVDNVNKIASLEPVVGKINSVFTVFAESIQKVAGAKFSSFFAIGAGISIIALSILSFAFLPFESIIMFASTMYLLKNMAEEISKSKIDTQFIKIGLGLGIISTAIYGFNEYVGVSGAILFATSVVILTKTLDFLNTTLNKTKDNSENIIKLSLGIAALSGSIMLFDFVSVSALTTAAGAMLLVTMFLQGLNTIGDTAKNTKSMLNISTSMILLAGAFLVFDYVNYESIVKAALGLSLLAASLFALSKIGDVKEGAKNMLYISGSLILLAGAFLVFQNVSYEGIFKASLALGVISLGMIALSKVKIDSKQLIALGVVSIILMPLSFGISMFDDIKTESLLKAGAAIGILALGLFLLSKVKINVAQIFALGIASVALIPIAYAMREFEDISFGSVLTAGITLIALLGILAVAGKMGANILMGSFTVAIASLSLLAFSYAINDLMSLKIDWTQMGVVGLALGAVSLAFAAVGAAGLVIAIGAGAVLLMAVSILAFSYALQEMNATQSVDSEKLENFKNGVNSLQDVFIGIANPLILVPLLVGMAQAAAIAVSAIALSAALNSVAETKIPDVKQIAGYKVAAQNLTETFADIGSPLTLLAATAGAGASVIIAGASILMSKALSYISTVKIDNKGLGNTTKSVDTFLTLMSDSFEKNKDKFEAVTDGIDAFSGILNLTGDIAKSVTEIGSLRFTETAIVNGKLVTKSVRELTDADFANVGKSIGAVINALAEPLAAISSKKDTVEILGMSITNPFSNAVENGIAALKDVGSVFTPLTAIVTAVNGFGDVDKVVKNTGTLFSGVFDALGTSIVTYAEKTADVDNKKVGNGILSAMNFVEVLAGEKGIKSTQNLAAMNVELTKFKDTLNGLDADKLLKFKDITMHLDGLDKEAMLMLSKSLEELSSMLGGSLKQQATEKQPTFTERISSIFTKDEKPKEDVKKIEEPVKDADVVGGVNSANEQLLTAVKELISKLSDGSLRGTVKLSTDRF